MWRLISTFKDCLQPRLKRLYPDHNVDRLLERMAIVASRYHFLQESCDREDAQWSEKSCLLITYGDMVQKQSEASLVTLNHFLLQYLHHLFSGVHILPFFPYSSDDGFSVIDYRKVDEGLGTWENIKNLSSNFDVMVDLVLNHISCHSKWFEEYKGAIAPARDYFIEVEPKTDLNKVIRPRTSPLLSPVNTVNGERFVWTTFSNDQVDLNFANPDVLLEIIDIMLAYIADGASMIRLDAIAYLWKEIGSSCVNLPQTHEIAKLLRDVLDNVAPGTMLLTETNLPHDENVSYFGNGNEAHLVYQFSLPPLLLHTIHKGSASHLQQWASSLEAPPQGSTFINFTASHDGIGIRPLENLLTANEIDSLVSTVKDCGGLVSSRSDREGRDTPYELNSTYFDALKDPSRPDDIDWQILRFLCSQAIMLCFRGIPAIYFHSLFGAQNNLSGVKETGQNRTINRGKWSADTLHALLDDQKTISSKVFTVYKDLLEKRQNNRAFHPDAPQLILDLEKHFFGLVRTGENGSSVFCIHNVSSRSQMFHVEDLGPLAINKDRFVDLISGKELQGVEEFKPYQFYWLAG